MSNLMTIAGRQFRSYFNGPIAYIVICVFLLVLGFLFWQTFFLQERATVREMFNYFSLINYFTLPAVTMGLLAEEKRTGTIELLITMPVSEAQVVIGKFVGVLGLYAVMMLLTLPYVFSVASLGDLDWGPVVSGYLGLLLQGMALIGIGLMCSSFTDNQLIAFFAALAISVFFFLVDKFLPLMPRELHGVLGFVSMDLHLDLLRRGVIAVRDALFFLSVTALTVLIAFRALESRRWS